MGLSEVDTGPLFKYNISWFLGGVPFRAPHGIRKGFFREVVRVSKTIWRETAYIALFTAALSVLMQIVYIVIGKWNYTVLLGNLLSGGAAVLNFFLMGLTVQSAVEKEEKQARNTVRISQSLRMVMLFAAAAVGVGLPCFDTVASIVPLFFPRIAAAARPLFNKK